MVNSQSLFIFRKSKLFKILIFLLNWNLILRERTQFNVESYFVKLEYNQVTLESRIQLYQSNVFRENAFCGDLYIFRILFFSPMAYFKACASSYFVFGVKKKVKSRL